MSSPTAVLVGVVLIQVGMSCLLVYNITENLKPCTALALLIPSTVVVVHTPIVFLCISIVGIYVVVILRIVRQHSTMHIAGRGTAGSVAAMKRRTRTLGIIIVLSLVGNMPRSLLSFFSLCVGPTTSVLKAFTFCNYLLVLNPLLDPLTYVFCIKEFRDRLKLFFAKHQNSVQPVAAVSACVRP
ncbi:TAAR [Mytilus edulis]|uniref:TAAR n=1 Tax=Mytilus edulis TaxID=6550 RepID=A0A8S3UYV1_MYTED|nr:TAAR [Mytilus edulis]